MRHWKTTLFGMLAGAATLAHQMGLGIGHLGAVDFIQIIQMISLAALGVSAADAKRTN
jgi:hypothetical protein